MKKLFLQTLKTIVLSSIIQGMLLAKTTQEPIFTGQYSGKEFQEEVQNSTNSGQIKLPDGSGYVFTYKDGDITYTVDVNQRWEVTNISKSDGLLSNTTAQSQTPLTPPESSGLGEIGAGFMGAAAGLGVAGAALAGYEIKKRYDNKKTAAKAAEKAAEKAAAESEKAEEYRAPEERKKPSVNPQEDDENTPRPLTATTPLPEDQAAPSSPDQARRASDSGNDLALAALAAEGSATRAANAARLNQESQPRLIEQAQQRFQELAAKTKITAGNARATLGNATARARAAVRNAFGKPFRENNKPAPTSAQALADRPTTSGAFSYRNTAPRGAFGGQVEKKETPKIRPETLALFEQQLKKRPAAQDTAQTSPRQLSRTLSTSSLSRRPNPRYVSSGF